MSAAALSFFLQWAVYGYITKQLTAGTAILSMLPFAAFWKPLALVLLAAGLVLGVGGSTVTIRKFLKV